MSIKAFHTNGIFTFRDGDERIVFEVDSPSQPNEIVPIISPSIETTEIIMGPLPPPPLPTAQVVVTKAMDRKKYGEDLVFRLQLDTAFETGTFKPKVVREIQKKSNLMTGIAPLVIDALLPANRVVDLTLLSRHVSKLSEQVGHKIEMNVVADLLDE